MKPPEQLDVPSTLHATALPVADSATVRRSVLALIGRNRRTFTALVGLQAVAAMAALVGPQVLALVIQGVSGGTLTLGTLHWLLAGRRPT